MTKQEARILLADAGLSPESMEKADALLEASGDELSSETANAVADIVAAERTQTLEKLRLEEAAMDEKRALLNEIDNDLQKAEVELEDMARALEV